MKFVVQYELEFYDGPSVNDVVEIDAENEEDAMSKFDNNEELCNSILDSWNLPMCVTANAAWPA